MNGLRAKKTARSIPRRAWLVAALLACLLPLGAQAQTVTYEKTEQIVYENNKTAWVIGQVKSVICAAAIPTSAACNGDVVAETSYDAATALPLQTKAFGKIQQTLTYNLTTGTQDGTLATVKDGNNNITTLSNWKRGIPQTITHPATTDQPTPVSESAVVNNDGTIASVTDETQSKTCYGYDAMGRINLITYPSETANVCDESKWTATTVTFQDGNAAAYGVPYGHWRQTTLTGRGRKILILDALWRPVVEQTLDLDLVDTTRSEVVRRYDSAGRLAFQSYPMNTQGTAVYTDTTLKGTDYTYDALDRPLTAVQDSELGTPLTTTTEYLTGFQTRVTNPRTYQTVIQYQAYDQPVTELPVGVTRYAGVDTSATEIARDPHGKPLTIKQRNAGDTLSATRSYTYNTLQELCRTDEPETGVTALGYDAAGNLVWSAAGVTTTATGCMHQDWVVSRRADRTYDARNRLKTLTIPDDGQGNTSSTTSVWAPDGLLASITADNGNGQIVTTSYTYNRRRLLELERMQWGTINWPVDYAYNPNGHLASQTFSGFLIDYLPDDLGRPTKAGTSASGVSYHPNGGIKQFTYGNGITHTLTQNVRGLPDTSCDSYGACGATSVLNDGYDYDGNGNVAAISDGRTGNRGHRTMTYDGLDRLTRTLTPTTPSPMFGTQGANYTYDALDNLMRVNIGGTSARDHYYCYNAQWQLAFIRTGPVCTGSSPSQAPTALEYDEQGNLKDRNSTVYDFDLGNRLRSVKVGTTPISSYVYDGHGRRVRDFTTASKYSLYSHSGQLVFDSDGRTGLQHWYVYLQGSLIEIRERNTATNVYTTKYQHTDALGSPVVMTDANRQEIERREYEPYGKQIKPVTLKDGPGYTGHMLDAATGLNYMQQRYYDPGIGRFLSVDPVTADGNSGGNFNRYWYANNNPYKFTDPDGRQSQSVPFGVTPQIAESLKTQGQVAPMRAAGERAGSAAVLERTAVKAVGTASMGTGINAEKTLAGNSSDQVGWVPVGQGAFAGVIAELNVISVDLFDGAANSPFSFEASGDVGFLASIGGEISLDPGGKLDISLNLGLGFGEHTSFSPTLNVDVNNKQPEPPPKVNEELRNK
jgi:RHS repeat-associated protein